MKERDTERREIQKAVMLYLMDELKRTEIKEEC